MYRILEASEGAFAGDGLRSVASGAEQAPEAPAGQNQGGPAVKAASLQKALLQGAGTLGADPRFGFR